MPFSNPNAKDIGAAKSVGIGLTFCKTIVEAHGSQIYIESEVGKGTTFSFDLPSSLTSEGETNALSSKEGWDGTLTEAEKTEFADLIAEMQKYELYEAELQDALDSLSASDNPRIQLWKNALQIAKDEDDEVKFKGLLG